MVNEIMKTAAEAAGLKAEVVGGGAIAYTAYQGDYSVMLTENVDGCDGLYTVGVYYDGDSKIQLDNLPLKMACEYARVTLKALLYDQIVF